MAFSAAGCVTGAAPSVWAYSTSVCPVGKEQSLASHARSSEVSVGRSITGHEARSRGRTGSVTVGHVRGRGRTLRDQALLEPVLTRITCRQGDLRFTDDRPVAGLRDDRAGDGVTRVAADGDLDGHLMRGHDLERDDLGVDGVPGRPPRCPGEPSEP